MSQNSPSLLVLDPHLANVHSLVQQTPSTVSVHVLSGDQDAIKEITELLLNFKSLKSLHLFTHAENGELALAKDKLGQGNIDEYKGYFSQWKESFEEDADLLIYGCDMGNEITFLESLSDYTGLNIAASDDVTGASLFVGDNELEYTLGDVATKELFSQDLYDEIGLKLDQVTYTGGSNTSDINTFLAGLSSGATVVFDTAIVFTADETVLVDQGVHFVNNSGGNVTIDGGGTVQLMTVNTGGQSVSFNGLTFQNGSSSNLGGAILIENTQVNIYKSNFINNQSSGNGGAINIQSGSLKVYNTNFDGNRSSDDGGAIATAEESASTIIDIEIYNSKFINNSTYDDGGAINKDSGGVLTIQSSQFTSNTAGDLNSPEGDLTGSSNPEGGAINVEEGQAFIDDSIFDNNSAVDGSGTDRSSGDAINVENSGSVATVSNSVFLDEDDAGTGDGGDVLDARSSGEINILNSTINDTPFSEGTGGDNENVIESTVLTLEPSDIDPSNDIPDDGIDLADPKLPGVDFFGEVAGDYSGNHFSSAGDVNGDGYDDFLIGSAYHNYSKGAVYLIFGGTGLSYTDLASLGSGGIKYTGLNPGDKLTEASGVGDFNGDGLDDFVLSARNADGDTSLDSGASYVIFGSTNESDLEISDLSTLDGTNGFKISGEALGDDFGWSTKGAGDFNGDGYGDIIIGADRHDDAGLSAGSVYIVYGAGGSPEADLDLAVVVSSDRFLEIDGNGAYSFTGYSVDSIGDMDGDGFDDVIIAAPGYGYNSYSEGWGEAYVVFGAVDLSTVDLSTLENDGKGFSISGKDPGGIDGLEWTAYDVSSAGDFNGDGFDDLLVGSGSNYYESGKVFMVFGSSDRSILTDLNLNSVDSSITSDDSRAIIIESERIGDFAGFELSDAGDVNGDGYDDIIFSAQGTPGGADEYGRVYLLFGGDSPSDLDVSLGVDNMITVTGVHEPSELAVNVSSAGDVDGDGYEDFLIGDYRSSFSIDPGLSEERLNAGDSYLVFGGDFIDSLTNEVIGTYDAVNNRYDYTGSALEDNFIGTDVRDNFRDLGSGDAAIGGFGGDRFFISDVDFLKIDGGAGSDRLVFPNDGNSLSLDLSDSRIESIERIVLRNNFDHELTLSFENIRDLPEDSNVLRVIGGSTDTVKIPDTFQFDFNNGNFDMYTHTTYTNISVQIDVDVALETYPPM